jgi:hypothetical protein
VEISALTRATAKKERERERGKTVNEVHYELHAFVSSSNNESEEVLEGEWMSCWLFARNKHLQLAICMQLAANYCSRMFRMAFEVLCVCRFQLFPSECNEVHSISPKFKLCSFRKHYPHHSICMHAGVSK